MGVKPPRGGDIFVENGPSHPILFVFHPADSKRPIAWALLFGRRHAEFESASDYRIGGMKNKKNRSSLISFYKYVTPSGGFAWENGYRGRTSNLLIAILTAATASWHCARTLAPL